MQAFLAAVTLTTLGGGWRCSERSVTALFVVLNWLILAIARGELNGGGVWVVRAEKTQGGRFEV